MKKIVILLAVIVACSQSRPISPISEIEANGTVTDMVLNKDELIIGTDRGILQVYNHKESRFIKTIKLPKIIDFVGDKISAKIYSVDKIDFKYLILSNSGKNGYTNLSIYWNNQTKQLISHKDKIIILKARFIDSTHILLGLLGNEAILYDIESETKIYQLSLGQSKFSDFALNEDKSQAIFACESGVLTLIDTQKGNIIREFRGQNVDNVYSVDIKKDRVVGAGQDRRGSIYSVSNDSGSYIEGTFLVYATALSPSANIVAFAMDEENSIYIYKPQTKEQIAILSGQKSRLSSIIFQDEQTLFSSSDDDTIMVWNIK
ncbi:MAG: WD40 repeat domain-containing protein [Sulfurovum sp.]